MASGMQSPESRVFVGAARGLPEGAEAGSPAGEGVSGDAGGHREPRPSRVRPGAARPARRPAATAWGRVPRWLARRAAAHCLVPPAALGGVRSLLASVSASVCRVHCVSASHGGLRVCACAREDLGFCPHGSRPGPVFVFRPGPSCPGPVLVFRTEREKGSDSHSPLVPTDLRDGLRRPRRARRLRAGVTLLSDGPHTEPQKTSSRRRRCG